MDFHNCYIWFFFYVMIKVVSLLSEFISYIIFILNQLNFIISTIVNIIICLDFYFSFFRYSKLMSDFRNTQNLLYILQLMSY